MNIRKIIKKVSTIVLIFLFLLSGWPGIIEYRIKNLKFRVGGEIQETEAVTCGFGSEIGTSGVCRGFLTTTGSLQTWTSPTDWNNSSNTIECIGAGGSGGAVRGSSTNSATGGGGGAYSLISNFTVVTPGTTQVSYQIGTGGTAVVLTGTASTGGNAGGDTWFNGSSFPGAGTDNLYCGAKGGSGGLAGAATQNGGAGGVGTSGWGQTRRSGGSGGTASHDSVATGGGGAAGNSSTGGNGVSSSAATQGTTGGQANGSGASGGSGSSNGSGSNGGDGTEYTTEGSGGGGGGGVDSANSRIYGGDGGKRGGGGGAAVNERASGVPAAESGTGYDGIIIITYTPLANPTITQNDWRIYVDNNALDPTDPWGTPDLGENSALTSIPYANDPLDPGDNIRIRITMVVADATLPASTEGFILQYGEGASCSAVSSWTDVDASGGSGIWRYYDNGSITDGTALSGDPPTAGDLNIGVADVAGRYIESDPTSTNPFEVAVGEDMEWDFNVQYNGNSEAHTYCFKIRRDTPADLDGYNAGSYPQVDTRPGAGDLLRHGNFFSTGIERGFFWAD